MSRTSVISRIETILANQSLSESDWDQIFNLSAAIEKTDIEEFHQAIERKLTQLSEKDLESALLAMLYNGRKETRKHCISYFSRIDAANFFTKIDFYKLAGDKENTGILEILFAHGANIEAINYKNVMLPNFQ